MNDGARIDEQPLVFDCEGAACVGVLAGPAAGAAARDLGVLIAVGGPQVRTGSHRQFTLLARRLAAAGWPSLRFDTRGMGDSDGEFPGFEHLGPDLEAAAAALRRERPGLRGVVVWGLCDAASAAMMNLPRLAAAAAGVQGCVLLNPWARHVDTYAATEVRSWYAQRLKDPAFWRKLASGGVDLRAAARELPSKLARMVAARLRRAGPASGGGGGGGATLADTAARHPDFRERMAAGVLAQPMPLLLLLAGRDFTADEFSAWAEAHPQLPALWQRPGVERAALPEADHTFSSAALRRQVEDATLAFLERVAASHPAAPADGR